MRLSLDRIPTAQIISARLDARVSPVGPSRVAPGPVASESTAPNSRPLPCLTCLSRRGALWFRKAVGTRSPVLKVVVLPLDGGRFMRFVSLAVAALFLSDAVLFCGEHSSLPAPLGTRIADFTL